MKNKQKVEPMLKEQQSKHHDAPMTKNDLYFALDCEMVGIGPDGFDSAVARVTVINWEKEIVLDTFVKVPVPVTDFRTHVSGIRPEDIESDDAMTFEKARAAVEKILRGKILIGHGLECDLCALGLSHPWSDVRDTARYAPYMRETVDYDMGKVLLRPRKLRDLTWEKLGLQIQEDSKPHSPIEDAAAALDLYKDSRVEWEEELRRQQATQYEQLMAQQRKSKSAFGYFLPTPPPVPAPNYSENVHNVPYQVPYDPSICNGPYGSQIPGFSPPPQRYAAEQPRRPASRRWFSRSKSPDKNREKEAREEPVDAPPARPSSPRSSGLFSSFRRNTASKQRGMVQQSFSAETETTSGTETPNWDLNSENPEWQQPNTEEQLWKKGSKPRSSRLFAYLSLEDTDDCGEEEEIMEIFKEREQKQEWQPSFYGEGEWSNNYHENRS